MDSHNDGSIYPVHRLPSNFQETLYTLLAENHKHALDSKQALADRKLDIIIVFQEDLSVRIILPGGQILIEAAAVEEIAEERIDSNSITGDEETITKCWTEEEYNESLDPTAFGGYLGDAEDENGTKDLRDRNGNVNKNFRKQFGVYPEYRIRLNGVRYITIDSSDEDELDESIHLSEQACRGLRKGNKRSKLPKVTMDSVSSSEDKGNGEESEPVIVHIVSAKKKKLPSKRRFHTEEVDTTASEESDVENLTDCSLCCGD